MGYDRNNGRQHSTSCAILVNFQPVSITKTGEASPRAAVDIVPEIRGTSDEMLNALIERIKGNMELHHAPGGQENGAAGDPYGAEVTQLTLTKLDDNAAEEQTGNGNNHSGVPNERATPTMMLRSKRGTPSVYPSSTSTLHKMRTSSSHAPTWRTPRNKRH